MTDGQRESRQAGNPPGPSSILRGFPSWIPKMVSKPLATRVALSILLLACVGLLDAITGFEISFSVFYLVPVLLAGGTVSRRAGRAMAAASAATWGYLDVATGHVYSAAWILVWNSTVRLAFFLIVNELVDMLRLAHAREREFGRTDSLTGIANGRMFEERANEAIVKSRRDGRPFTITYVDLDRFKHVNDTFGHAEGDRLLRTVAAVIKGRLRATDVLARLGGDEFGILMPETGAEQARTSLERIAASLVDEVGERWGVGATLGAVTFSRAPDDLDFAIRMADNLMYRGKGEGRGSILQETWPKPDAPRG